jgi:hypothetical protein
MEIQILLKLGNVQRAHPLHHHRRGHVHHIQVIHQRQQHLVQKNEKDPNLEEVRRVNIVENQEVVVEVVVEVEAIHHGEVKKVAVIVDIEGDEQSEQSLVINRYNFLFE